MNIIQQSKQNIHKILIFLILTIGILLRLPYLSQSIWLDEAFSVDVASKPLFEIPTKLAADSNAPLHYFMLHFWIILFGNSEIAIRSLSLFWGFCTLSLVYFLGEKIASANTALLAAFLLALSPFHIYYSQEARPYALVVFFSFLSFYHFWQCLQKKQNWLQLGATNSLLALTHYWGFFLVCAELLFLMFFIFFTDKNFYLDQFKIFAKSLVISSLIFLPWLPIFLVQLKSNPTSWLYLDNIYRLSLRSLKFFTGNIFLLFLFILFLGYWLFLVKNKKKLAWLLFFLSFTPLLLAQIVSFKIPIYQVNRHDILVLPIFLFFIAVFTEEILANKKLRKMVLLSFVSIVIILNGWKITQMYKNPKSADRLVANYLFEHTQPNDLIIFTFLNRNPFQYYYNKQTKPLTIKNYPSIITPETGFFDYSVISKNQDLLLKTQKEALALANNCLEELRVKRSCFLLYSQYNDWGINNLLLEAFSEVIGKPTQEIIIPERQPFYKEIIYLYKPR